MDTQTKECETIEEFLKELPKLKKGGVIEWDESIPKFKESKK